MPLVQNISFSQLNVTARWMDLPAGTLIQTALMNPAIGASPIVGMVCNIDEGMSTIPVVLEFEGARAGTLWTVQDFGQGPAINIKTIADTLIGAVMPVVLPGGFPRKGYLYAEPTSPVREVYMWATRSDDGSEFVVVGSNQPQKLGTSARRNLGNLIEVGQLVVQQKIGP